MKALNWLVWKVLESSFYPDPLLQPVQMSRYSSFLSPNMGWAGSLVDSRDCGLSFLAASTMADLSIPFPPPLVDDTVEQSHV